VNENNLKIVRVTGENGTRTMFQLTSETLEYWIDGKGFPYYYFLEYAE